MFGSDEPSSRHDVYGRVIVHADLDCFYCQVEHVRLGIPTSTPLAVQQWDGLIAVNYEARKFGVKRGDRTAHAKQKCPEIVLVHVETIGGDDDAVTTSTSARHDKGTTKVSLERYREASFAIMAIFQAHCRRVERASIDEAYMDLTEEAAKLCQEAEAGNTEDVENAPETDLQGTAGHRVDPTNAFDRALLAGARLTAAIRLAVKQELGFTVSAGIASNKVLAKLASSRNKPNKQTVVPAGASSEMLDTIPARNLRGLGGKLGETVVAWSKAETASDLKRFSQEELVIKFGSKTGEWLWRICRGMDDETVTPNLKPKSLSVCKSFTPVRDREAVLAWMTLLAKELAQRIRVDREAWGRRATKLTLQMISHGRSNQTGARGRGNGWKSQSTTRSRTVDIPGKGDSPTAKTLVSEAMTIFAKTDQALPCSRLALTAHEFSGLVSGQGSIASFLRADSSLSPPSSSSQCAVSKAPIAEKNTAHRSSSGGSPFEADGGVGDTICERDVGHSEGGEALMESGGSSSSSCISYGKAGRFHRRGGSNSLSPEPSGERCPKCGAVIAADELPEHLDFHYAEGLQERYSREGQVAAEMAARVATGGTVKRLRRPEDDRGSKRQRKQPERRDDGTTKRIDSFFKPT